VRAAHFAEPTPSTSDHEIRIFGKNFCERVHLVPIPGIHDIPRYRHYRVFLPRFGQRLILAPSAPPLMVAPSVLQLISVA